MIAKLLHFSNFLVIHQFLLNEVENFTVFYFSNWFQAFGVYFDASFIVCPIHVATAVASNIRQNYRQIRAAFFPSAFAIRRTLWILDS